MQKPLNIVVFSKTLPREDFSSGEKRLFAVLKILAEFNKVYLVVFSSISKPWQQEYVKAFQDIGVQLKHFKYFPFETLLLKTFDIVIYEYYWLAKEYYESFKRFQPYAFTLIDSVDVHFAREKISAQIGIIPIEKTKGTERAEIAMYKKVDGVIAVSNEDEDILKDAGIKTTYVIPNIIDIVQRDYSLKDSVVIFVGSNWYPNIDGVAWFVKEIWPLIHKEMPESKFLIIGSCAESREISSLANKNNVIVIGYVKKIDGYLKNSAVSVAPLRHGGGMKGKVNEAMAYGIPVVTTSIGAQGLDVISGKELFIEDQPDLFANKIIKLLKDRDLRQKIGTGGQTFTQKLCSRPAVRKRLIGMLVDISESKKSKTTITVFQKIIIYLSFLKILILFYLIKIKRKFLISC